MSVYFATDGERIKIGFSSNPYARRASLSSQIKRKVTILAILDGDRSAERKFHKRFGRLSVGREWFKFEGPLRKFVRSLPPPPSKKELQVGDGERDTHIYLDFEIRKQLEAIAKREARSLTGQITVFIRQGISQDQAK